jgi:hypothetical protein
LRRVQVQSSTRVQPLDHEDLEESMDPVDPPSDQDTRPRWLHDTLRDAERHVAPKGTFKESRPPQRFLSYVALMSSIIESKPSIFEEATSQQVWKDAMMEEYRSIVKNDVWDIVLRQEEKFVVTSKWIYKIKHAADGSIEKYKARFVARRFSQKEGVDYEDTFALVARYTSIRWM